MQSTTWTRKLGKLALVTLVREAKCPKKSTTVRGIPEAAGWRRMALTVSIPAVAILDAVRQQPHPSQELLLISSVAMV